jgi:hypothetical protein
MPLARLPDDARGRNRVERAVEPRRDEAGALARRSFFFDGPYNDDANANVVRPGRTRARAGGDKRRERTLGVNTAAAMEQLTAGSLLDADRDVAWNCVDVPQKDDGPYGVSGPELSDRISGFVDVSAVVTEPCHPSALLRDGVPAARRQTSTASQDLDGRRHTIARSPRVGEA